MNALLNTHPPPPTHWHLRIKLKEGGNPACLQHARNIINSYLEPKTQWQRTRIMKDVHEYKLKHVDRVIDESIFNVVQSELLSDAYVTREGAHHEGTHL